MAPTAGSSISRSLLVALLLAGVTLAVFGQVAHFEFLGYDDPGYVSDNPTVRSGLTVEGLRWAFGFHESNWHPLTWLSLMLDAEIGGDDPAVYHLHNLALHVANTLLLFLLLLRTTGHRGRSGFVALLFAIHPLHVESVAWIAERKDVLSTLFWFLALLAYAAYARRPGAGRYLWVVAAFAAGLMSKPMLVTLPALLLLLDLWPLERLAWGRPERWAVLGRLILEKLPLFALSAASAVITVLGQRAAGAVSGLEAMPLASRVGNAAVSYVAYLGQMVWPSRLSFFYPHPGDELGPWTVLLATAVLVAATLVALRALRRFPWVTVGWFWYLVTLLPVIGLVQVGLQARADRYTYVSLLGPFVLLVWGAATLTRTPAQARVRTVVAVVVAVALAAASYVQTGYWRDSVTLYRHALDLRADNPVAHTNLATTLLEQGDLDGAIEHARRAVEIEPRNLESPIALGTALAGKGKLEEAIAVYRGALERWPASPRLHTNLGAFLAQAGRLREAEDHLREAVRLAPGLDDAHHNLGIFLGVLGRYDEAAESFAEAQRLDPFDESTGRLLEKARELRDAEAP